METRCCQVIAQDHRSMASARYHHSGDPQAENHCTFLTSGTGVQFNHLHTLVQQLHARAGRFTMVSKTQQCNNKGFASFQEVADMMTDETAALPQISNLPANIFWYHSGITTSACGGISVGSRRGVSGTCGLFMRTMMEREKETEKRKGWEQRTEQERTLQTTQPPKVLFPPERQDTVIEITPEPVQDSLQCCLSTDDNQQTVKFLSFHFDLS
ncbi:hypothetical protein PAMP_023007 [Pampus punctatissimus]